MILKYSSRFLNRSLINTIRCLKIDSNQELFVERLNDEYESGIYVLNFNRQSTKNALGANLVNSLIYNVQKLKSVNDLKVLILASKVKGVFCAGADLKERFKMNEEETEIFVTKLRSIVYEIFKFPKPTICALDGVAIGGGLEMALACDLRICSTDAKLGLVETSLAILPGALGSQLLPRIVGLSIAKEMIFSAKILSGDQAAAIHLVNEVKEQNENFNAALLGSINLAKRIAHNGPIAVQAAKLAINESLEAKLEDCLEIEKSAYKKVLSTRDRLEGIKSFIEKRKPVYKGY